MADSSDYMSSFTPVTGLVGGLIIGLAAATLVLFGGLILGASGITSSYFIHPKQTLINPENQWKAGFLASFLITAKLWATYGDASYLFDSVTVSEPYVPVVSGVGYGISGFLVGYGTRLGNGCTSGHGVCGMARMSIRSFANVGAFMVTGFLSGTLCGAGCPSAQYLRSTKADVVNSLPTDITKTISTAIITLVAGTIVPSLLRPIKEAGEGRSQEDVDRDIDNKRKFIPGILSGALFAIGLAISGMIKQNKVFGFLDLTGFARGTWDATLVLVLGGAFFISFLSYQFIPGYNVISNFPRKQLDCPLIYHKETGKYSVPTNKIIDMELILGGAIFGVGWGIGGLCPGPAMWLAAAGFKYVLIVWWPFCLFGAFLAEQVKNLRIRATKQS